MTKVSIITPIYNGTKYLTECLNAICNQTLEDIEIILIEDCSSDESLKIIEDFAQKDSRIIIIKNEKNIGQGASRNKGIKIARGEDIGFVDQDDIPNINMFEEMYKQAIELDSDVVVCAREIYFQKLKIKKQMYDWHCIDYPIEKIRFKKLKTIPIKQNFGFETIKDSILISPCLPWNKLYKRELLLDNNIFFSELRMSDDVPFTLLVYLNAKNISYIDKILYCQRKHCSTSWKVTKANLDDLRIIPVLEDILSEYNEDCLKDNLRYWILFNLNDKYNRIPRNLRGFYMEEMKKYVVKEDFNLLSKNIQKFNFSNFFKSILR